MLLRFWRAGESQHRRTEIKFSGKSNGYLRSLGFVPYKVCQACVISQLFGIFFKTNVAQSFVELILYSQKHEMWSFYIKFGELSFKNVNNTFMVIRNFT